MANHYPSLNPEKALIWRIVHRDNLPWILDNGVHCKSSAAQDPNFVPIGNADLIDRRTHRVVPIAPGGVLSNYVPFYFTPFSPMMYNIYTGRGGVVQRRNQDICILVSSVHRLVEQGLGFVFTDRHAYTAMAQFFNRPTDLSKIDWSLLQSRNFSRNADDPGQIERYQAEALVYQHMPVSGLLGVICHDNGVKMQLEADIRGRGLPLEVYAMPGWYF